MVCQVPRVRGGISVAFAFCPVTLHATWPRAASSSTTMYNRIWTNSRDGLSRRCELCKNGRLSRSRCKIFVCDDGGADSEPSLAAYPKGCSMQHTRSRPTTRPCGWCSPSLTEPHDHTVPSPLETDSNINIRRAAFGAMNVVD